MNALNYPHPIPGFILNLNLTRIMALDWFMIIIFRVKIDLKYVITILETMGSNKFEPIYKIGGRNDLNV